MSNYMKIHSNRFVSLCEETKKQITQTDIHAVKQKLENKEAFYLVDVREESEWAKGHIPSAIHLSKGIIERDIEKVIPAIDAHIILYCGGGYRSALAALSLQKMGYTHILSMNGGYSAWKHAEYPLNSIK